MKIKSSLFFPLFSHKEAHFYFSQVTKFTWIIDYEGYIVENKFLPS